MIRVGQCGSLAAVGLLTITSFGHAQGSVVEGYDLAVDICAECHAIENGSQISPNLNAPPFSEIAGKPGINSLSLSVWFRTPHPTMPNFVFSDTETDNLVAYILSLPSR